MREPLYVDQRITETLEKNFMPYAMSVIVSRAIPEIDGFKPSHRKILYTMYKMKLLKGNRTKSANIVGQTMKLNPHGDQAIYATMVRLSKGNESLLLPFVDSKGNFGKTTSRDMRFAAPRYTEAKLDDICEELFKDIDKSNVDFVNNYDGTMLEPTLLPTTFPNILANPNKGIAVGMASNFPGFNLTELCEATISFIQNPYVNLIDLLPAPDFPTAGAVIYNRTDMQKIYDFGIGSFKVRGKIDYIKSENMLEITEIPYTTTVEQIIEKIVVLIKVGRIKEINDIRDETDLNGLKIAIDLKRGTEADTLISKLYKFTPLEDSFSCNMNLLISGRPMVLGVKAILQEWLIFRRNCIKRSTLFDIERLNERLLLLYGLQKVLLDIDLTIKTIRETEHEKDVITNLMHIFDINETQANFIADIRLRYLNKEYILKRVNDIDDFEKELIKLQDLINNEKKIDRVITKELHVVIKKYGKQRKTRLISSEDIVQHVVESQVEDYNLKVFLTAHNYFKKVPLTSLRSSGDHKLKNEDEIRQEIEGNNKDEIIFFTSQNNAYKLKLNEIDDHKVSSLGVYLPNILGLELGEVVLYCVVTNNFSGFMIFGFENGKVARVSLEAYKTKTNRKKLVKSYSDEAKLVTMHHLLQETDLTAIRESSKEIRTIIFNTSIITEKVTRNTKGVQVFRLKKGSVMTALFKTESHPYSDDVRYRISDIPKSGEELDPIEKLTKSKWLKF